MNNIVLIDHEPFTKRRKELFYIDNFIKAGFEIEVWDISQYIFRGIHIIDMVDNENYVVKLNSYKDIVSKLTLTDVASTIFIVECFYNWHNRKIYRLLSDNHCYTVRIDFYANTVLRETIHEKLSRLLSAYFFKCIIKKGEFIATQCYKRIYGIKDFDRIFSSSSLINRTDKINHPDYENYRFKRNKAILSYKYIVFCDNYFPYHPDFKYAYKYKVMPDGQQYQKSLNIFFNYLEKKYKMPVVIAAHPKAEYKGTEFGLRPIIKYKTDNLVLNSYMVVLHASNSISYAVLADKPVVFITTKGYNSLYPYCQRLYILASRLSKKVWNIDKDDFDDIQCTQIKKEAKDAYINTYLTSLDTKDIDNLNILQKAFKAL